MLTHLRQRFWTATVSARRYGLSASTIHNRLRKKNLSQQCGPHFKGQKMTRRHRLAYVQGLDAISSGSVSTGTWFRSVAKPDLHSTMLVVKRTNKRCWDCYVLKRGRSGGGNFVVFGGKMGDQKTYFVVMQDNFNALYRRCLVTSCHTISPLFLHIKY